MYERFIKPVLAIIAISLLVWIIIWFIYSSYKKKQGIKISLQAEIAFFLFYLYIIGVMCLTIIPLPFERFKTSGDNGINITPLVNTVKGVVEIFSAGKNYSSPEHTFQNIAGNIILFIPLGIFLPLLSPKFRYLNKVILLALFCSFLIEVTQLILRQFDIFRIVDIDDIILNVSGAILGFILVDKLYFK